MSRERDVRMRRGSVLLRAEPGLEREAERHSRVHDEAWEAVRARDDCCRDHARQEPEHAELHRVLSCCGSMDAAKRRSHPR